MKPPRVDAAEIAALIAEQIGDVLVRLAGHPLYPIVALALGTGMRRGELCGLAWGAVDLDNAAVRVERSLKETAAGLRFKAPKTRAGRRVVSLPPSVVEMLQEHRKRQLGGRILSSPLPDGSPYPPDKLSRDWGNVVRGFPRPRKSRC